MSSHSALRTAALIVVAQIACMMAWSGGHGVRDAYFKLLNWDSMHYQRIASTGYQLPAGRFTSDDIHAGRANVVFFPGYPFLARGIHQLTGFSVEFSLLLLAHLSALVVWLYFLLLLRRAGLEEDTWPALIAVLAYPSTFFLVAGYTESLFMAGALGFIYWSDRWMDSPENSGKGAWALALIHGWILSATRIVGFAVAAYPILRDFARKRVRFLSIALLILSVAASIAFFAFCQWRFGDWAIYFRLEEMGWHNHRLYFAILNPLSYVPHFFFEETVDSFSRSAVTFCGFLFVAWGMSEWRLFRKNLALNRQTEIRWARGVVALAMFYIALTGKADAKMDSMIRYTFPVYVLLVLNFFEINRLRIRAGDGPLFLNALRPPWRRAFWIALGFGIGFWNMYRFTHGKWVA